ncbi:hypothetical protein F4677DRAFT_177630 [Hypoxylon crocopeplum]|nr:hypothetical protein F4677DRAFT_177630 [Hypoxylon crocopeplum]
MSSVPLSPSLPEVNDGPYLLRTLTPMAVVVTLFVGLRIAVRIHRCVGMGVDDWLILLSLILSWANYALAVLFVNIGGLGRPAAPNDISQLLVDYKFLFASQWIYATVIVTTEFSVLAMYRRIFPTRFMKIGCQVLGVLGAASWLISVLLATFQCSPVKKVFDPFVTSGWCLTNFEFFFGNSIHNIITNIAILCLPIYEISTLRLPRSQRVSLIFVFLTGTGVIAASAIRLWRNLAVSPDRPNENLTMEYLYPVMSTVIEPDLGIICACMPVLSPLLKTVLSLRWLRHSKVHDYNHKTGKEGPIPVALRSIRTIGGSSMHRGVVVGGSKKIHSLSLSPGGLEDNGEYIQIESSSWHRGDINTEPPNLWPPGYAAERRIVVEKADVVGNGEVPNEAIAVETVLDWQESSVSRYPV